MVDLNIYEPSFPTFQFTKDAPSTAEVIGLSAKSTVMPVISSLVGAARYGITPDPNYKWQDNVKGYEQFSSSLSSAVSSEDMAARKKQIELTLQSKQRLADATLGQSLVGELFNPVNFVTLPFGGPAGGILKTIGQSALRAGATQAAIEATLVQPFDATATAQESAMNVLTTTLFGGAIGAVTGSGPAIAYNNTQRVIKEFGTVSDRLDNLKGITPEVYNARQSRDQRVYGILPDAEIKSTVANIEGQAKSLRDQIGDNPELKDQVDALDAEAMGYRNELGLRALEDNKINLADPYSILPSAFTDSILFKAISTPMKRTLQGNYPTAVKEKFVKLANDSGITMLMNSFGMAAEPSVYLRSAVAFGKIAKAHDDLIALWASDTNASPKSLIDLNGSDLARRASRSPDTYGRWLEMVSEKRMKGITEMTENELKASSIINDYFENAAKDLEDVGLIGTQRGMEANIKRLDDEIVILNAELKAAAGNERKLALVTRRLSKLETEKKFREVEFAASGEVKASEPFFPRFFDQSVIKANRKEFSDTLFNWYQKNPSIWELDYTTGKWTQKELSTRPEDIQARVDMTIDKILGLKDPTDIDATSFGVGRSKHFRHRELDIPNSLVTKFMMRDPLAVMKTYSARIQPRYEFQKMFNKDYDGVLHDMELEMLKGNMTEAEINRVRRDFDALYRRVAGNVLDNPSALNQKIAYFLREGASFAYMGGAGLASIPDFGRIVMEYDLETIVKGVQILTDRNQVKMSVDQVRYAGEAIDILKNSAYMRIQEDLGSNFQSNPLLNSARNVFYVLNGLAPITALSKQLAGIVDAHTIIEYSIKLSKGQLDDQSRTWLARHGIDEEYAKVIARAPWQTTKNGMYVANTDSWADSISIPEIEGNRIKVIEVAEDGGPVGKQRGNRYIPAFFNRETNTIQFDRDFIEGQMFEEKAWLNPKVEGVAALADIFKTPKQWANFVMLHEINHSRFTAEDFGIQKIGFNRNKLIQYINGRDVNIDTSNLVFHVTDKADAIINNGFQSGGATFNRPINEIGYGNIITVFDVSGLDMKGFGKQSIEADASWLLRGQKPVAVIHAAEAPNYWGNRQFGARSTELNMETEAELFNALEAAYLKKEDITKLPEFDQLSALGYTKEDAPDLIKDFKNQFSDLEKYSLYGVNEKLDIVAYENKINELAMADYKAAGTLNEEAVTRFRTALNSGVLNTIISGTPADKPIITDGVVYLPIRIAKQFGFKEDARIKGYARIENGFLGLPFQFYSFMFGSVNKTMASFAHGQIKNRAIGSAVMLGLAYMTLKYRTPDYVWENMSVQDKAARTIDSSGLLSLYSDLFYTTMQTTLAMGGPNITGGFLSPKFKPKGGTSDAIFNLAGAGPNWAADLLSGVYAFASGDYAGGGRDIVRSLPANNLWFLKGEINQIVRGWGN